MRFNVYGYVHRNYIPIYIQQDVLWVAYATHSTLKPVPTLTRQRQIAVTVWQIPNAVDTVVCALDDGWKYHPKRVERFPDINKLCNVASCWIYSYIGILLGAHPILHISKIRVKRSWHLMLSDRLHNLNWSGLQWYIVRTEFHELCEILLEFERVMQMDDIFRSPIFSLNTFAASNLNF
jgi:hypothetical protein